jgi:hypothetical protein
MLIFWWFWTPCLRKIVSSLVNDFKDPFLHLYIHSVDHNQRFWLKYLKNAIVCIHKTSCKLRIFIIWVGVPCRKNDLDFIVFKNDVYKVSRIRPYFRNDWISLECLWILFHLGTNFKQLCFKVRKMKRRVIVSYHFVITAWPPRHHDCPLLQNFFALIHKS